MTAENKLYFQAEKEAIFLILTGIGDEIYSTVDACNTAKEMWTAIERLQQGESLNVQDITTIRENKALRNFDLMIKMTFEHSSSSLAVQASVINVQKASDYDNSDPVPPRQNVVPTAEKTDSSQQGLEFLFSPLLEEYYNPTHGLVEENNNDQAPNASVNQDDFFNPFCTRVQEIGESSVQEIGESSSHNTDNTDFKQAEQADWLEDTDEEIDEQELEAHYSYMAKIQEVSPEESSSTSQPLEQVQNHDENDVFANVRRHPYVLEKDDSNVIPDSSNICTNDNQADQNVAECVDERAALANLTLDTEENKMILKQLKKANASLTQELEECKTNLDETSRALGEATRSRDSCLIVLQTKQIELEKYTALNDLTSDYKILQTKLNNTLRLLAIKDIDIQEGLKTKTYEISVVNQKHEELVKKSLLNRSQFEGQLKEKTKVISDLKVKEGKDIDTYLNDVNARTKKPKVVPISASKPKRKANKSVATPHKKTVASDTTIQKSKSYHKELYENTNQE
ncbi:hypothetical protein Tco_0210433 [Tanacetum coccineum]